jgi:hypothetical protein
MKMARLQLLLRVRPAGRLSSCHHHQHQRQLQPQEERLL